MNSREITERVMEGDFKWSISPGSGGTYIGVTGTLTVIVSRTQIELYTVSLTNYNAAYADYVIKDGVLAARLLNHARLRFTQQQDEERQKGKQRVVNALRKNRPTTKH